MAQAKIFGIGLSKTGTYSLTVALQYLGYTAIHYPTNVRQIERYDAATDIPVTAHFETLDGLFPGSKFIYTARDKEAWLESCRRHYLKRENETNAFVRELRQKVFGVDSYDRETFNAAYDRHDVHVRHYFASRPNDLLIVDVCQPDPAWAPVCRFLEKPIPNVRFPWGNRTGTTEALLRRLLEIFDDPQRTAEIAHVYPGYVESLARDVSGHDQQLDNRLDFDDGGFNDEIVARVTAHFGNVATAAARLRVPQSAIERSLTRYTTRLKQRTASEQPG